LEKRLAALRSEDSTVSIVSFEEQTRGWLAWIHRSRKPGEVLKGYHFLRELLHFYSGYTVLPFDPAALSEFQRLNALRVRIGTKDLRIAAVALVHRATVITRNLRDFRQVPGLAVEDWTVP
jgi:tRNA(fMet)-specific endonuclease VapC